MRLCGCVFFDCTAVLLRDCAAQHEADFSSTMHLHSQKTRDASDKAVRAPKIGDGGYEIRTHATPSMHLSETCGSLFELPTEHGFTEHSTAWRIRLVVYGARLESVLV